MIVRVSATLSTTGLYRLVERLGDGLGEPGVPRGEREHRLAQLRDVLAQANTLDHVGVRFLDALVGAPLTHFDGLGDARERVALLGGESARHLPSCSLAPRLLTGRLLGTGLLLSELCPRLELSWLL